MFLLNPFVLIGWGLVAFIFYLQWRGFYNIKRFWNFGPFTTLVYSIIGLVFFMAGLSYLANSEKHQTFAEQLKKYQSHNDFAGELKICIQRDSLKSGNLEYQMAVIDAYLKIPDKPEFLFYQNQKKVFQNKLGDQSKLGNECEKARANHLLMYWHFKAMNINVAKYFAKQEIDCYSPGFYSMASGIVLITGEKDLAYQMLMKSIELNPNPTQAFKFGLSNWKSDSLVVNELMNHKKALKYVDFSALREYFLARGEMSKYFYSLYFGMLLRYHPFFILISFLIVASIGYYLYSIDLFERDSIFRLITIFIIGCAIVPMSLYFSDMYDHGFNWFSTIAGKSEWLNMVLAVGVNEEIIKLIPFLIAVYVFKWANEPIDYIIYAAVGALSFAFLENTMYFERYNGDIVFARTIFSTLGHIFDSSVIAYGLAYNRFRFKKRVPPIILIPFLVLLAASVHGTYNTIAGSGGILAFLLLVPFMVVCMALLGGFLNNGMNNSPHFNKKLITGNEGSINMIGTAFVLLYMVQQCIFIYMSGDYDNTSNRVLNTVSLVAIMVIVIAYYLGTFDVVRGKWQNLFQMVFKKRINRNLALGLNCEIYTNRLDEIHHFTDYLLGQISDRVMVEGDDAIFLVRLKTPYTFDGNEYKSVLIRHIFHRNKIMKGVEIGVRFIVPISKKVQLAQENLRKDFEYVGDAHLSVPEELQAFNLDAVIAKG